MPVARHDDDDDDNGVLLIYLFAINHYKNVGWLFVICGWSYCHIEDHPNNLYRRAFTKNKTNQPTNQNFHNN